MQPVAMHLFRFSIGGLLKSNECNFWSPVNALKLWIFMRVFMNPKSSMDSPHSSMLKELSNCLHWPRSQAEQHGRGVAKWRVGKWSASSETAATCHGGTWPCGQSWISCVDIDGTWFLQSRVFLEVLIFTFIQSCNHPCLSEWQHLNLNLSWKPHGDPLFSSYKRHFQVWNKVTTAVWSTRAAKTILEEACNASPASVWNYQASVIDSTCPGVAGYHWRIMTSFAMVLPGFPILGDGKGDNQNHGTLFSR